MWDDIEFSLAWLCWQAPFDFVLSPVDKPIPLVDTIVEHASYAVLIVLVSDRRILVMECHQRIILGCQRKSAVAPPHTGTRRLQFLEICQSK